MWDGSGTVGTIFLCEGFKLGSSAKVSGDILTPACLSCKSLKKTIIRAMAEQVCDKMLLSLAVKYMHQASSANDLQAAAVTYRNMAD